MTLFLIFSSAVICAIVVVALNAASYGGIFPPRTTPKQVGINFPGASNTNLKNAGFESDAGVEELLIQFSPNDHNAPFKTGNGSMNSVLVGDVHYLNDRIRKVEMQLYVWRFALAALAILMTLLGLYIGLVSEKLPIQ